MSQVASIVVSSHKKIRFRIRVIAFVTAVLFLGVCSQSSPLYPFNDWVDPNCFFTVGRSMLRGKIPYLDIYEQKGPIIYFLHATAALISDTTFLGVYFLEIIAGTLFLFISYEIIALYNPGASPFWIPLVAAFVYGCPGFCQGDSAEELSLCLVAYSLYVGLKALQQKTLPSDLEFFLIGCFSSCILWSKYSMLGLYPGWYVTFFLVALYQKKCASFLKGSLLIGLGVLVVSLPILIYFLLNHALWELLTSYFYNNVFYYSQPSGGGIPGLLINLSAGMNSLLVKNLIALLCFLAGLVLQGLRRQWSSLILLLFSGSSLFFLCYCGGVYHPYYSLIFSAFAPLGAALICWVASKFSSRFPQGIFREILGVATGIACLVVTVSHCGNTHLLAYEKADMPQFQFAAIINEIPDATLLNYRFLDGGFYNAAGIIPNCPAFCRLNIPIPSYWETQDAYVNNGWIDFVVTQDQVLQSDLYHCVAQSVFNYEGLDHTYYLYKLNSLES